MPDISPTITVREVTDEDIMSLAEFLPTGMLFKHTTKETWLRRFEIWWKTNPAYSDLFPKGWVLENNSSIVGFMGNLPVKFLLCGEIKTGCCRSFLVCRSLGPWSLQPQAFLRIPETETCIAPVIQFGQSGSDEDRDKKQI